MGLCLSLPYGQIALYYLVAKAYLGHGVGEGEYGLGMPHGYLLVPDADLYLGRKLQKS